MVLMAGGSLLGVGVRPAAEACGTATDADSRAVAPRTTRAGRVLVELMCSSLGGGGVSGPVGRDGRQARHPRLGWSVRLPGEAEA